MITFLFINQIVNTFYIQSRYNNSNIKTLHKDESSLVKYFILIYHIRLMYPYLLQNEYINILQEIQTKDLTIDMT